LKAKFFTEISLTPDVTIASPVMTMHKNMP